MPGLPVGARPLRRRALVPGAFLLVACVPTTAALAQQSGPFSVTPRLDLSTTYTDNVGLAPSGQEESDLIFSISPGVSARADGNRISGSANYSLRNRFYLNDSDRNDATQVFDGRGNAELLEDFLFLDASAQRRESAFSLLDPVGIDEGVRGPDTTEVTTWRVSPYVTQRLGRVATLTARYAHERVDYGRRAARDQYTDRYSADLDSGTLFGRFFWSANYDRREIRYQEDPEEDLAFLGDTVILETVSGTAGWDLTRRFRIFGTVGEERNRFETQLDDRDGGFWNAGFVWSPSRRTTVEGSVGERFFGDTRSLSIQHRRRSTVWRASYLQEISTNQTQARLGEPGTEGLLESIGEELIESIVDDGDFRPVEREEVSLFERAQTSVRLEMPRSRWTLLAFYSEREFLQTVQETQRDLEQIGAQGLIAWDLGPRTTANASVRWARSDRGEDQRDTLWSGRIGLSRQIQESVRGSLSYRHQQRSSDEGAGREFRENAVTATLNMTF